MSRIEPFHNKRRLAEAYLSHRVDSAKFVELAEMMKDPLTTSGWQDRFDETLAEKPDSAKPRRSVPAEKLAKALEFTGITQDFEELDESQTWTGYQRAVHRRMAHNEVDYQPPASPSTQNPDPQFLKTLGENFNVWDRNRDLRLEPHEVDFAMSGGAYGSYKEQANEPYKAATLAIIRRYDEILGSADPNDGNGVSVGDLEVLKADGVPKSSGSASRINEVFQEYLEEAEWMATDSTSLLEESFDADDLHQGTVGSCVYLSSLAGLNSSLSSLVMPYPEEGLHKVVFADDTVEIVPEPTVAERLYHARGKNLERWPAVLEIAMAQKTFSETKPKSKALRSAIDGVKPEAAIKALTGKETLQTSLDEISVNQTRAVLSEYTSRDGPVIVGSRPTALGDFVNVEELHNGIVNGHCYSVQDYDAEKDTVKLQNPWHKTEWAFQNSPDDGVFEMPVVDFFTSFRWIARPE